MIPGGRSSLMARCCPVRAVTKGRSTSHSLVPAYFQLRNVSDEDFALNYKILLSLHLFFSLSLLINNRYRRMNKALNLCPWDWSFHLIGGPVQREIYLVVSASSFWNSILPAKILNGKKCSTVKQSQCLFEKGQRLS